MMNDVLVVMGSVVIVSVVVRMIFCIIMIFCLEWYCIVYDC